MPPGSGRSSTRCRSPGNPDFGEVAAGDRIVGPRRVRAPSDGTGDHPETPYAYVMNREILALLALQDRWSARLWSALDADPGTFERFAASLVA